MPQHTVTFYNTPQHARTHHNMPQHTRTQHNVLQHAATPHNTPQHATTPHNMLEHPTTRHSTPQRAGIHRVPQHPATPRNMLEHTTCYDTPQHPTTPRNTPRHARTPHNTPHHVTTRHSVPQAITTHPGVQPHATTRPSMPLHACGDRGGFSKLLFGAKMALVAFFSLIRVILTENLCPPGWCLGGWRVSGGVGEGLHPVLGAFGLGRASRAHDGCRCAGLGWFYPFWGVLLLFRGVFTLVWMQSPNFGCFCYFWGCFGLF